ncbi:MAG: DNA topoisomerase III, partial [Clostridia bacterium]|nr:DNA topoisomerase III [Clostridia bacterium]
KEDKTKPPAPHTDASLLAAMETAGKELDDEELVRQMKGSGIGTPATRAAIIERLLKVGYAQRKGKTLNATDKGVMLIDVVPGELSSPELTGRWELALHDITDGKQDPGRFMNGIARMSEFLVKYARENAASVAFPGEYGKAGGKRSATTVLQGAVCPVCGKGGMRENSKAFGCTEKDCHCTIWKDCLQKGGGPAITGKLLLLLLEKKRLQGSTGILTIENGKILFYPNGSERPSAERSLIYTKQH